MIEQSDFFEKLGFPPDADIGGGGAGLDGLAEPAQATIDDEIAAAMKVPAYFDGNDPQHRRQVSVVQGLFAKKAEGDSRSNVEKVCDTALEQQSQKQTADYDAAMADRDWLLENGFDSTSDEPPDVVPEFLAQAWKMQRLRVEGDYANLGVLMEKSLNVAELERRLPQGHINAMRELLRVEDVDPALKDRIDQIADGLIALLHDAHVPKKGKR